MRILVLINRITPSSIPFELSIQIAETTETEIVVVSFYDEDPAAIKTTEPIHELPLEVRMLGATSRLDPNAWNAFRQELIKGYDIVHTHHNFSGSVARILARIQGITVADTEHRDHNSLTVLQNLVNAPTLPLAKRIIANSHTTRKSFRWYERLLLNHNRIDVIYNGVDLEQIQNITETTDRSDKESFRVCTVGRMVPVKNQSTLIRAFQSVVDQHPQAELLLVGDGSLRRDLESLAVRLGIEDAVHFTGYVPREQVYELYAQSDVFVIPSMAEGFCVAAVEAMAAGLPIVASDIPIFHEVIGDCGIYAYPSNPSDFGRVLTSLLGDPDRRQNLGEACSQRARTKFSLDQTAEQYCKLYNDVAEDNGQ